MNTETNKLRVRRFYEEIVSTGHIECIAELVVPECVETDGLIRVESGVEGMAAHVAGVRKVYPDLKITVER